MFLVRGRRLGHPLPQSFDRAGAVWSEDTAKLVLKAQQGLDNNWVWLAEQPLYFIQFS